MQSQTKEVIRALIILACIILPMSVIHPLIVGAFYLILFIISGSIYKLLHPEEYESSKKEYKKYTPPTSYFGTVERDSLYWEDQTKLSRFMLMKKDYLSSSVWDKKRKAVLDRDNYTCQHCGTTGVPLAVHHRSGYNLIPHEPLSCLVALCKSCHTEEHDLRGYPQTYEEYMTWGNN